MTNKLRYTWAIVKIWKGNEFLKWLDAASVDEAMLEFNQIWCYDRDHKNTERTIDDYYIECYRYDRQIHTWDQDHPVMRITGREMLAYTFLKDFEQEGY